MPCSGSRVDFVQPFIILILFMWTYYVYVVEICINEIRDTNTIICYLVIYHIISLMMHWCLFKVIFGPTPTVPRSFRVSNSLYLKLKDLDSGTQINALLIQFCDANELTVVTRNADGHIRFCKKCKHVKPDRAHHCSVCGKCILRMDHHCPWLNSCIHLWNYKFFVLLLFYVSLNCIFFVATSFKYFMKFWSSSPVNYGLIHMVVGFVFVVFFGVLITLFFLYHVMQICYNRTSIELLQKPKFSVGNQDLYFDLGPCGNFKEIMGDPCWLLFFPVDTNRSNGVEYPLARRKD